MTLSSSSIKTVLVIGVGPAGLVALKTVLEDSVTAQWNIIALERNDMVGGVWNADPSPSLPPALPRSPIYNSLTTNLPHPLMAFTSDPFPESTPLFPHHTVVKQYLHNYALKYHLARHCRFGREVVKMSWQEQHSRWRVTHQKVVGVDTATATPSGNERDVEDLEADYVLVCTGHYYQPHIPDFPGAQEWLSDQGRSIVHSIHYRTPLPYSQKTIVVVGAGPSGRDISREIADVAKKTYWVASRGPTPTGNLVVKQGIERFGKTGVCFTDGSVADDVNVVICATGYEYSFPFLLEGGALKEGRVDGYPSKELAANANQILTCTGKLIHPLYRHMFPAVSTSFPPDRLCFLGLPSKVVPFPLIETQAACAVRVLAGRAKLPEVMYEGSLPCGHELADEKQFQYREDIAQEFGAGVAVQPWARRIYANKEVLREAWKSIERKGPDHVKRWVDGVHGVDAWVEVMDGLIHADQGQPCQFATSQ
ncbi:hypothetical protein BC832DRAFT_50468 [Gaertneriomyces semiglobifer]|nr:hypothetical protein BC832DRAFT_50468 [Gaertneriomyces semiglobifer]